MQEEEQETATPEAEAEAEASTETATDDAAKASADAAAGKGKGKRGADKTRRSHAERAMANVRSAKKGQREVSDPVERAQFLLAEANVLALLELAEAISGRSEPGSATDEAPESD